MTEVPATECEQFHRILALLPQALAAGALDKASVKALKASRMDKARDALNALMD